MRALHGTTNAFAPPDGRHKDSKETAGKTAQLGTRQVQMTVWSSVDKRRDLVRVFSDEQSRQQIIMPVKDEVIAQLLTPVMTLRLSNPWK